MSDRLTLILMVLAICIVGGTSYAAFLYGDNKEKQEVTEYTNPDICTRVLYTDKALIINVREIEEVVNKESIYNTITECYYNISFGEDDFIKFYKDYLDDDSYNKLKLIRKGDSIEVRFKGWIQTSKFLPRSCKFDINFSGVKKVTKGYTY